ncbi:MAG: N-acetylmuramoyl-L-alanine amidase [Prolixibacteraceae bacterium]|nr:N-acetylmuramoyl-L-alanine amidase [Prolixibacteraceae bacterium]
MKFSYAQGEYQTTVAEKGDGIYNLLRKNNLPLHLIDEFLELNKNQLGASNELIVGKKYLLPVMVEVESSVSTIIRNENEISDVPTATYSIFGENYQKVPLESSELAGGVYYLVSGHGGPDPGAIAKYNGKTLCEDEYAYDITLRLARNLISKGALVYMITRDSNDGIRDGWYLAPDKDEKCYPNLTIPINQNSRLKQRKDAVNKLYKKHKGRYQRLIVIHVDSRSKGEKIDVFFYYDQRSSNGKKLCINLRETFDEKYNTHQPGRGYNGTVSQRNLFMLKYSWPVATFIELGNINHQRDLKRFIIDDNRQALANWLTEGLVKDFGNNKQ